MKCGLWRINENASRVNFKRQMLPVVSRNFLLASVNQSQSLSPSPLLCLLLKLTNLLHLLKAESCKMQIYCRKSLETLNFLLHWKFLSSQLTKKIITSINFLFPFIEKL